MNMGFKDRKGLVIILFSIVGFTMVQEDISGRIAGLAPYRVEQPKTNYHRFMSLIGTGPVTDTKSENPLIIYFGGATGAGKTVLGTLYAQERGISYDAVKLAKRAGISTDFEKLRTALHLGKKQELYVLSVPKPTTREPRLTEMDGFDFYFVSAEEFERLRDNKRLAFTYQYPKGGAWYGVPASISWPTSLGLDSLTTMTGYEAFSKMAAAFPSAVGILVDAGTRDIEAHIKGRAASQSERETRLSSFPNDRRDFYEHRHDIPYSVMIDSLKALRTDITPDRVRLLLQEMDNPLRQVNAIVRWERYLRENGINLETNPQARFDHFLDHAVRLLFNGMEYGELRDRVGSGHPVSVFDLKKDDELLARYTSSKGISRALLDSIVEGIQANAVLDANGRRTIILSPYSIDYVPAVGGTGKRIILDLLAAKLNGTGAHLIHDGAQYKNESLLSLLKSPFYHIDEGLYATLSSDHVPVRELESPRSLNILFSNAPPEKASTSIKPIQLEEVVDMNVRLARDETVRNIFLRATQP